MVGRGELKEFQEKELELVCVIDAEREILEGRDDAEFDFLTVLGIL